MAAFDERAVSSVAVHPAGLPPVTAFTLRLLRIADTIDALTDSIGRVAAWLVLIVIALLFAQWPLREIFGRGHLLANDIGQIVHAAVFMFGLSYALRWDRHVRMDVFYRRMSPRRQAMVNFVGTLFLLLPWCALMAGFGWSYAWRATRVMETFPDTWSPGYFVFKLLLVLCFALLGIQALSITARTGVALFADSAGRPIPERAHDSAPAIDR